MFGQVNTLLSFVFAVALTHLLSSATELLIARDRVRFSGLHTIWMVNAALILLNNWLALWGLVALKLWTISEVVLQFVSAIVQYFTCSTLMISAGEAGVIDVPAIFDKRRRVVLGAFMLLGLIACVENYWDRNNMQGVSPTLWIGEDSAVMVGMIPLALAGWARPLWLQWAAALVMAVLNVAFISLYAIPG